MRVAAIDIGTNSVLLLVAELRGANIVPVSERATITRLGERVDATRRLAPAAIERTLTCLSHYADEMRALGVSNVVAVGTSAMRDAEGGSEFVSRAGRLLGVEPRVIPGGEEAELTFRGALVGLHSSVGPVMVFDVGGGSTEIVVGQLHGATKYAVSLDMGSVRLTERNVHSDPPAVEQLEAIRATVRSALATVEVPLDVPGLLVGVAGTVTTIAAYVLDVVPYDGARVHGSRLSRDQVSNAVKRLASMSLAERRRITAMDPARADVIVAGGVIVEELIGWAWRHAYDGPKDLVISDRGVRWGLVQKMLAEEAG